MTDAARERGAPDRARAGTRDLDAGAEDRMPRETSRASVGEYFARQRRLREISMEELVARTRIPRRNIERLESGALDEQADGFTRGLVRTLAEALGLDVDEAVMRLLREPPADDEVAPAVARRAHLYGAGAAVAGLAIVALLLRLLYGWWMAEEVPIDPRDRTGVTYRTDVVRSLAREAPAEAPGGGASEPAAESDTSPGAAPAESP